MTGSLTPSSGSYGVLSGGAGSPKALSPASGSYGVLASASGGKGALASAAGSAAVLSEVYVGSYSDAVLADSPYAYYRLNDVSGAFLDYSGNGRHATGWGTLARNVAGLIDEADSAVRFENPGNFSPGLGGGIETPFHWSNISSVPEVSVEFWMRVDDFVLDGMARMCVGDVEGGSGVYLQMQYVSIAETVIVAQFADQTDPIYLSAGVYENLHTLSGGQDPAGTFHIVATFDATEFRLYGNGALWATVPKPVGWTGTFFGAGGGLPVIGIGNQYEASAQGEITEFDGRIDEVAFYDYALPASRVSVHYAAG